jgi:asparagine synthase (glutamine-hydrolysing)
MCGIAGILNLASEFSDSFDLQRKIDLMNITQYQRGPDGVGTYFNSKIGLGHRRLSIISHETGAQPMFDNENNSVIVFNGEIYNTDEVKEVCYHHNFKTQSDTEVILAAYNEWGNECTLHLKGMFAFAIWDKKNKTLFCSRDRFGIKPFYYTVQDGIFYFASEIKTLLPFVDKEINLDAISDYFTFQFTLGEKTFFKGIFQLNPAHNLIIKDGEIKIYKYWEINYQIDFDHTKKYFIDKTRFLLTEAINKRIHSDVEIGSYLSGGLDSSIVTTIANKQYKKFKVFHGTFIEKDFKEDYFVDKIVAKNDLILHRKTITPENFLNNIEDVIYYLDQPVAGPGAFSQYMVAKSASKHLKVVIGGQGGDEIFGGYARYLLAYFEQCIKGAIDGTMNSGNFIVTYESIIPNLSILEQYKPLMKEFWSNGLFEEKDERYFKLINKSNTLTNIIDWNQFSHYSPLEEFKKIFWGNNINSESYFDLMSHFDFKTLLPALLHVDDRMSMAHSIESRSPFLDHELIEFLATIPANVKFENGKLKALLKESFSDVLPSEIVNRKTKMGFPVPLNLWAKNELREFIGDIFNSQKAKERFYFKEKLNVDNIINSDTDYSRNLWGLLSLELWQQIFIDEEI